MILQLQYELVKSSRAVLLHYCEGISEDDFITVASSFGHGSIRNLLVHIGNTYEYWLGRQALGLEQDFTDYGAVRTAAEAKMFFLTIDRLVERFVGKFGTDYLGELPLTFSGRKITGTPLQLFSHVITHEFHHKGQILSLSRQLGYTPVDTDIMR